MSLAAAFGLCIDLRVPEPFLFGQQCENESEASADQGEQKIVPECVDI